MVDNQVVDGKTGYWIYHVFEDVNMGPVLINRGYRVKRWAGGAGGANSAGQSSADCHGMAAVGFDSCLGRTGMVERLAQARSASKHFPNVCNVRCLAGGAAFGTRTAQRSSACALCLPPVG